MQIILARVLGGIESAEEAVVNGFTDKTTALTSGPVTGVSVRRAHWSDTHNTTVLVKISSDLVEPYRSPHGSEELRWFHVPAEVLNTMPRILMADAFATDEWSAAVAHLTRPDPTPDPAGSGCMEVVATLFQFLYSLVAVGVFLTGVDLYLGTGEGFYLVAAAVGALLIWLGVRSHQRR